MTGRATRLDTRAAQPSAQATVRTDAALLELVDIHHRWSLSRPPVLNGASLTLAPGTFTGIAGRNGVGKTTLLRIAAGILVAQSGTVRLDGLDPIRDRGRYHRRLGFLSAGDRGLHARMSVTQHLDYWARLAYVPRAERQSAVTNEIEAFGLEALARQRVDRMSMGQRQRVRLAMAFLHRPDVVLLDEPRNSLDEEGHDVLNERISTAVSHGAAVLWCSPRVEDDRIAFDAHYALDDGRLEREP